MSVVVSLPTRNRPEQLIETIVRSLPNFSRPDTVIMVQVDEDDAKTIGALHFQNFGPRVTIDIRPREDTIAAKWNRALELPASLYVLGCDDTAFITPDTDTKLLEAAAHFPDGIGMVYGHMANASFSSVVAMTKGLTDRLGHMFPEYFPYWFVDHWTDDLARLIGRLTFASVATDQSKPGKTMELREPAWWATWFDAAYLMREKIARDIINGSDFQTPEWQKNVLRSAMPLIAHRSRFVNSMVRADAARLHNWSGLNSQDERYQRVKRRAAAMVPHLLDDYGMHEAEAQMFRNALIAPEVKAA